MECFYSFPEKIIIVYYLLIDNLTISLSTMNTYMMHFVRRYALALIVPLLLLVWSCSKKEEPRVLVFSKTTVFRHESIGAGIAAIKKLGEKHRFIVDTTENAASFYEENLKRYKAVIFLST